MKKQCTAEQLAESNGEVPETGVILYAKVWLTNSDGSIFKETKNGNNTEYAEAYGLLSTRDEKFTLGDFQKLLCV